VRISVSLLTLTYDVHERSLLVPIERLVRVAQADDQARAPAPIIAVPEHKCVPLAQLGLAQEDLGLPPLQVLLQLLDHDWQVVGIRPQDVPELAVVDPEVRKRGRDKLEMRRDKR
jgi:hypothetical protein